MFGAEPTLIPCGVRAWKDTDMNERIEKKPNETGSVAPDNRSEASHVRAFYPVTQTGSMLRAARSGHSAMELPPRRPWSLRNWGINE